MVKKLWHYHHFWVNAEHNCRLDKLPLPGQPDDGSITTYVTNHLTFFIKGSLFNRLIFSYDDIWKSTKQSAKGTVPDKLRVLEDGFERYMNEYFYVAKVFISQL